MGSSAYIWPAILLALGGLSALWWKDRPLFELFYWPILTAHGIAVICIVIWNVAIFTGWSAVNNFVPGDSYAAAKAALDATYFPNNAYLLFMALPVMYLMLLKFFGSIQAGPRPVGKRDEDIKDSKGPSEPKSE